MIHHEKYSFNSYAHSICIFFTRKNFTGFKKFLLYNMLEDYNFAYANVLHFKDEKEFKDPPYERQSYSPKFAVFDTHP